MVTKMNVVQRMQLKNGVERILHVPGNYTGGILEMALVCDYHMPEKELRERAGEIADCLKKQSEVFRNVRLNVVKWIDDDRIIKEIVPMAYVRMGTVFQDYGKLLLNAAETIGLEGAVAPVLDGLRGQKPGQRSGEKTLDELTRQLKLFYARSKVIIVLTDGSFTVGDFQKVQKNMQPFLHRKMLFLQGDQVLTGTEIMKKRPSIVFDMDGVLFDTEQIYMTAWKEIAAEQGVPDVEQVALKCIGLNETSTKNVFAEQYGADFAYEEFRQAAATRFRELVEQSGLPIKPGTHELLEWLKENHYHIALASSTKKDRVLEHLEKAGLRDYFQVVIGGDMVKCGKPDPEIYLTACRELGVEPSETYAVEDSPNGIRSAHGAGMKVIMVPDMIQPTKELEGLLYRLCQDLLEVKYLLAGGRIQKISFDSLANTRDLGGFVTKSGRQICPHRLLRSGALMWSSERDREKLVKEYGLKAVVDFRTGAERKEYPDPEMPGVENIWNPIVDDAVMGITREKQSDKSAIQQVLEQTGGSPEGPEEYMRNMYRNFVTSDYSRRQYKKFFEILLRQEEGSVLWHCSAGKDRVGVATALLLSALGVDREQIMTDYMKTNDFGKAEVAVLVDKVKAEYRAAVRMLFIVKTSFLSSVFEQIDREYGGMDAFLENEMGLTPDKLDRLRDLYLL